MKKRVLYLVKFYVATVLIFLVAKVFFILYHLGSQQFTVGDVFDVLRYGLSLDLSTSLYLLTVPFLLTIISLWVRIPKQVYRVYYFIAALLLALAFVADTSLYEFWKFKLDASCLQYLETPTEAMASVSTWYILFRLVVIILLTIAIYWVYVKITPLFPKLIANSQRLIATIIALLFIPLMGIGIRGGIDESTTNIGQVYYSQNQFLNHAAVNPVFSFFASFEHGEKDYYHYNYLNDETCEDLLRNVYTTESVDIDTLLTTQRPDIIVILLESCGAVFTELGGNKEVMPHLNKIASEGILFTQCYANSWRTDRGTVCTLSGWPSFPNVSVMKMPDKSQTMPSIAKTLKKEHYSTHYLYGGDINFTNMHGYLIATGWDQLTSMDDYSTEERNSSAWGVRDDITFETLYEMVSKSSSPYLFGYSTLSSHEPWKVPISQFDDEILNAFYYLDQCIGNFIDKLKKSKAWGKLLIVILSDHGYHYKDLDETNPLRNLIPVIWTGGAIKGPKYIDKICNQSDFAATLLGQMGLNHDDFTFSRDVLSQTYRYPLAVHNYNNAQSMIDSTGFILYDFDANRFLVRRSKNAEQMLQVSKAILQKTTYNLKNR